MSKASLKDQLTASFGERAPGPVTPWNPSRRALARVKNPIPVPDKCPHCGSPVFIDSNAIIYGKEYGEWPWALMCTGCDSYVGLHPFTGIPLGTLATKPIREARKRAKAVFNPLWQEDGLSRDEAYAWLATVMGIEDVEKCHIGWFDVKQCEAVILACYNRMEGENNA